jgi:AcrR family transcriptional regulator
MSIEPLTPQRRREQTREYLLRAAAQVFAERGFHGASLDDVASVAGFTKGAVYSNFKGKDDLFLALLELRFEEEMRSVRAILEATEEPATQLPAMVDLLRQQFDAAESGWGALFQEFCVYAMRNPEARAKLAAFERADVEAVAGVISAERVRHGLDALESPQRTARIVVALTRGLFMMRLIDADAVDGTLLEAALDFIALALTAPEDPPPGR